MRELFNYRRKMPASAESVYRSSNPVLSSALRLPGEKVRFSRTGNDAPGSRVTLRVSAGLFAQDWSTPSRTRLSLRASWKWPCLKEICGCAPIWEKARRP